MRATLSAIKRSEVNDVSYGENYLVSKNDKGLLDIWLPGGNATMEDVLTLLDP